MRIAPAQRFAVLISGRGSNLKAILDAHSRGELPGAPALVVSNREGAGGLDHAKAHGVPTEVVDHRGYDTRAAFEDRLIEVVQARGVEVVVLAGFMRLLTGHFLAAFENRVLNIHPSLLPAFPGVDAQSQALRYGVKVSGCTVHLVDEGKDTGPIIEQAVVPILPEDDDAALSARILVHEHRLLPRALSWLLTGRLELRGRQVVVHAERV